MTTVSAADVLNERFPGNAIANTRNSDGGTADTSGDNTIVTAAAGKTYYVDTIYLQRDDDAETTTVTLKVNDTARDESFILNSDVPAITYQMQADRRITLEADDEFKLTLSAANGVNWFAQWVEEDA